MSKTIRLALVSLAAAGLAVAVAAPVHAATAPGVATITSITIADPTIEDSDIEFVGECETLATQATVWVTNVTTGDELNYFGAIDAVTKIVTFSNAPSYGMGGPGDELSFRLECFDAADVSLATSASQSITVPDFGATATVANVYTNQSITLTGTCGTAADITRIGVGIYSIAGDIGIVEQYFPVASNAFSFSGFPTADSVGAPAGQAVAFFVCQREIAPGEFEDVTMGTSVLFEYLAVPALAATGTDAAAPLGLGGILLAAGAGLLALRRRATV